MSRPRRCRRRLVAQRQSIQPAHRPIGGCRPLPAWHMLWALSAGRSSCQQRPVDTSAFTPDTPGTYRIDCLVPGHDEGGMWGTLEVTSSGTPSIAGGR